MQLPQLKKSGAKISNWEVIFILWENVDYANMYQASQPFEWLKLRWWRRSRRWLVHTHSLFSRFQNPRLSSSGEHKKVLNLWKLMRNLGTCADLSVKLRTTAAWSMSSPSWIWKQWSCLAFRWALHFMVDSLNSLRLYWTCCRRLWKWEQLRPKCFFQPGLKRKLIMFKLLFPS